VACTEGTNKSGKAWIGFEEAATAFEDKTALALGDVKHSDDEVRSILIGVTLSLKMVTVVHQRRGHRFADHQREKIQPEGEREL
jgi:uncharacterized DUF497 family protein